ncbi:hypothetical protein LCGC14_2415870, partial [marine sediment metagenome]
NYDQDGRLVINDQTLDEMYFIMTHPVERKEIVDRNFEIARRNFGFDTLRLKLNGVIADYSDEIRASRKRLKKSKMSYSV